MKCGERYENLVTVKFVYSTVNRTRGTRLCCSTINTDDEVNRLKELITEALTAMGLNYIMHDENDYYFENYEYYEKKMVEVKLTESEYNYPDYSDKFPFNLFTPDRPLRPGVNNSRPRH